MCVIVIIIYLLYIYHIMLYYIYIHIYHFNCARVYIYIYIYIYIYYFCLSVHVFLITASLIHTNGNTFLGVLFLHVYYVCITRNERACICVCMCICYFCAYSVISCTYYIYITLYIRYISGDAAVLNMKFSFSYLNIIRKSRNVK